MDGACLELIRRASGGNCLDFRSIIDSAHPLSLQVTINAGSGYAWVDIQFYNPLQGPKGFFGHFIFDIILRRRPI